MAAEAIRILVSTPVLLLFVIVVVILPLPIGAVCSLKSAAQLSGWQKTMLTQHNADRLAVSPPSTDMECMLWDDTIATHAQAWADNCAYEHSTSSQRTNAVSGYRYLGQNLAASTGNTASDPSKGESAGSTVVKAWSSERSDFTFDTNSCASGKMCGHYTQVVWHSSYAVGCGYKNCSAATTPFTGSSASSYWHLWVCEYAGGNYQGESPYTKGTVSQTALLTPSGSGAGSACTCAGSSVTCSTLPSTVGNGTAPTTATCSLPIVVGATCPLTCLSGYAASASYTCTAANQWSTPSCTPIVYCRSQPNAVVNGTFTTCTIPAAAGTTCTTLTCATGYVKSKDFTCTSSGQWDTPTCSLTPCTALPATVLNAVAGSCAVPVSVGGSCLLTCNAGYGKTGNFVCLAGGQWSTPSCVIPAGSCTSAPSAVFGLSSTAGPSCASIPIGSGSVCSSACKTGFMKQSDYRCTSGAWSYPQCIAQLNASTGSSNGAVRRGTIRYVLAVTDSVAQFNATLFCQRVLALFTGSKAVSGLNCSIVRVVAGSVQVTFELVAPISDAADQSFVMTVMMEGCPSLPGATCATLAIASDGSHAGLSDDAVIGIGVGVGVGGGLLLGAIVVAVLLWKKKAFCCQPSAGTGEAMVVGKPQPQGWVNENKGFTDASALKTATSP